MTRRIRVTVAALLLLVGQSFAQTNRSADVQFKAAEHKEQVEGDLKGAIDAYKKLADSKDRAVAAKALIRLAECYEKLGQADARKIYERVVREFSDQTESATVARGRLTASPWANGAEPKQAARQVWKLRPDQDASESLPSPDGRWMGYTDWSTGDLGLHDLMTGADRRLTNTGGWQSSGDYAEAPLISPDGREMIYTWEPGKDVKTELRILPLNATDKTQPRTVFRGMTSQEYITPKAWTRDGKQVLVVHNLPDRTSQLGMLSINDGSIRAIKSTAWQNPNASLSPDGRYIAYDLPADAKTGARDIFLLAVDGSQEVPLAEGPTNDIKPIWSADGSRVLFLSNRTGSFSLWGQAVQNGKVVGRPELIKPDIGNVSLLGPTRDGAVQYIGGVGGGASRTNIYVAEVSSDTKLTKPPVLAVENFLNSNLGPSWSPDGQYIAYFSGRNGVGSVFIHHMTTGEEWRVPMEAPTGPLFGSGPMWLPDGRSVLVITRQLQRAGVMSFIRADIRSGATEMVHETRMILQGLALSPDGKALFYSGHYPDDPPNQGRIVRFDIESRRETDMQKGDMFLALSVSPDSKQLAYVASVAPTFASYVATMPAGGGPARELFRDASWLDATRYGTLSWTPDQRFVMFAKGGVSDAVPNVLWRVPATGGAAEQVGLSLSGRIKAPHLDRSGRRLIFSMQDTTPEELWVLENFLPR